MNQLRRTWTRLIFNNYDILLHSAKTQSARLQLYIWYSWMSRSTSLSRRTKLNFQPILLTAVYLFFLHFVALRRNWTIVAAIFLSCIHKEKHYDCIRSDFFFFDFSLSFTFDELTSTNLHSHLAETNSEVKDIPIDETEREQRFFFLFFSRIYYTLFHGWSCMLVYDVRQNQRRSKEEKIAPSNKSRLSRPTTKCTENWPIQI